MTSQSREYNTAPPTIMHIDLNSCFATVEQQARPRLRGRPVAVVNRRTEHTMIVTCSYEAKAMGVTLGMRLKDAKKLCPDLIGVESDPSKYRYVYHQLMRIMSEYSPHVRMKSIDEGVIDFGETTHTVASRDILAIGEEIKQRLKVEVGCWMRCNVGISTNRFLAKTAASLHKPDGLDVITAANLRQVLVGLDLQDLTGIAGRFEHRLNGVGIYTPLEFLDADENTLRYQVFRSICGSEWHKRLRGWEVDKRDFPLRSAGRQYVLEEYAMKPEEVIKRVHHLAEAVGRKVRSQGLVARGVHVHARGYERGYWHARYMAPVAFLSDQAIFTIAKKLFVSAPYPLKEIGVSCYELEYPSDRQGCLFYEDIIKEHQVVEAVDRINDMWGERTIHAAGTLGTDMVKTKIPFGSTHYL
jgi:DNA polymerase-4